MLPERWARSPTEPRPGWGWGLPGPLVTKRKWARMGLGGQSEWGAPEQ